MTQLEWGTYRYQKPSGGCCAAGVPKPEAYAAAAREAHVSTLHPCLSVNRMHLSLLSLVIAVQLPLKQEADADATVIVAWRVQVPRW